MHILKKNNKLFLYTLVRLYAIKNEEMYKIYRIV